jgi:hypothetical protein
MELPAGEPMSGRFAGANRERLAGLTAAEPSRRRPVEHD